MLYFSGNLLFFLILTCFFHERDLLPKFSKKNPQIYQFRCQIIREVSNVCLYIADSLLLFLYFIYIWFEDLSVLDEYCLENEFTLSAVIEVISFFVTEKWKSQSCIQSPVNYFHNIYFRCSPGFRIYL